MNNPLIRCEAIHKSYRLGRTILPVIRGITLRVAPGRFLAITGSSGSGKSTLLHVMSGLDVPQRGQVFFRGEPIFAPPELRRIPEGDDDTPHPMPEPPKGPHRIPAGATALDARLLEDRRNRHLNASFGFVFQFYHLLPEFDVLENVILPAMVGKSMAGWLMRRTADHERALELLKRVGLSHRLKHKPNELSGGERQRVAIARALMNEPAILFADEPTGNLDARTGREIFELLRELNGGGLTVVMVTHDRELARGSDEVVHLVDGRIE
jgi:lipoprotein-releasing system ATP-binding protein